MCYWLILKTTFLFWHKHTSVVYLYFVGWLTQDSKCSMNLDHSLQQGGERNWSFKECRYFYNSNNSQLKCLKYPSICFLFLKFANFLIFWAVWLLKPPQYFHLIKQAFNFSIIKTDRCHSRRKLTQYSHQVRKPINNDYRVKHTFWLQYKVNWAT